MSIRIAKPFEVFKSEALAFIHEVEALSQSTVSSDEELQDLKKQTKEWENRVSVFLSASFVGDDNYLVQEFYEAYPSIYRVPGGRSDLKYEVENQKKVIATKSNYLSFNIRFLEICDAIVRPDEIDLQKRKNFTMNEKLGLILEKLAELDGDYIYPVKPILEGNGILLKRMDEDWELAKMLESRGFVDIQSGLGVPASIMLTGEGRLFIEEAKSKQKQKEQNTMEEHEIRVFISHGGSDLWKDVDRFINKKLELDTVILKEANNRGRTIIEKLEQETENCDFAIIVMTAEDEQKGGELRARQNVIHEIGFCQGAFGRENVLVLKQKGVEEFTNISGIVYEEFIGDSISSTFERIRQELDDLAERIEEEYEHDEEE